MLQCDVYCFFKEKNLYKRKIILKVKYTVLCSPENIITQIIYSQIKKKKCFSDTNLLSFYNFTTKSELGSN